MGRAVLELQNNLPLARVVYASATGEPCFLFLFLYNITEVHLLHTLVQLRKSRFFTEWLCFPCHSIITGASEPKNMIYMSRLGIWGEGTSFSTFDEFLHAIEKRYSLCRTRLTGLFTGRIKSIILCLIIWFFLKPCWFIMMDFNSPPLQGCGCNGDSCHGYEGQRHVYRTAAELYRCQLQNWGNPLRWIL